jgi:hypothetical protein
MVEMGADDVVSRSDIVAAVVTVVVVVAAAYASDRVYRRWVEEVHLLTAPRARLARAKTGYRRKRASVTEVVQIINDVLAEVARATSAGAAS